MMLTAETFLAEIEKHLERTGTTPTAFGKNAVGDPNLVSDLRAGRMPGLRLVEKIFDFMRETPGEKVA